MKWLKGLFLRMETSIFLFPCVVSIIFSYYLLKGISLTHPRYGTRCGLFALLITIIWAMLFIWNQWKIYKKPEEVVHIYFPIIPLLIIAIFLGIYLGHTIWGTVAHSVIPYEMIDTGKQHTDDLIHSTMAESVFQGFFPASLLNNGEPIYRYHTFSHLLIGAVSSFIGIPAFVGYNFVYPVLFIPLYVFSQLVAIGQGKLFFEKSNKVLFLDVIVMSLFNAGILYADVMDSYAVFKPLYIGSESFMIANTLAFFAYAHAFFMLRNKETKKKTVLFYRVFVLPFTIFIISWTKISVGFLFTILIMYFFFRTKIKDVMSWVLNAVYGTSFIAALILFNNLISGWNKTGELYASGSISFRIMALSESWVTGRLGIWGHYLILGCMVIIYVVLDCLKHRYDKQAIRRGDTVIVESLVIATIIVFLPAFFVDMYMNSFYFSAAIEVPAMCLLCGHDYVDIEKESRGFLRGGVYFFCTVYAVNMLCLNNRYPNPVEIIEYRHETNLSEMLLEIHEIVKDNKDDYVFYLDSDSIVAQTFPGRGDVSTFVCPAMTGVGVINASYRIDGVAYCYTGDEVSWLSCADVTDMDHALSIDEAIDRSRAMGKEKLIHVNKTGYEIIDLI